MEIFIVSLFYLYLLMSGTLFVVTLSRAIAGHFEVAYYSLLALIITTITSFVLGFIHYRLKEKND